MKNLILSLALAGIIASGCSSPEKFENKRITRDTLIFREDLKQKEFKRLYRNPMAAWLGRYNGKLKIEKIHSEISELKKKIDNYEVDVEDLDFYTNSPGELGDKIADNLEKCLANENLDNSLSILFAGAGNMVRLGIRLSGGFDIYYFSKESYALSQEEFEKDMWMDLARFRYKAEQNDNKGKPRLIIFGDNYAKDADFEWVLPTYKELKNIGIEKINFLTEGYCGKKDPRGNVDWSIKELARHHVPTLKRFARYLRELEVKGMDIKVYGVETDGRTYIDGRLVILDGKPVD